MIKPAGKLAPKAKPRVVNLLFQAFFVYSRVAYTIFPHTFSEKWHLRQDRREELCHFRLGYEEKQFFYIEFFLNIRFLSFFKIFSYVIDFSFFMHLKGAGVKTYNLPFECQQRFLKNQRSEFNLATHILHR